MDRLGAIPQRRVGPPGRCRRGGLAQQVGQTHGTSSGLTQQYALSLPVGGAAQLPVWTSPGTTPRNRFSASLCWDFTVPTDTPSTWAVWASVRSS